MIELKKSSRVIMLCDFGLDDAVAFVEMLENADRYASLEVVAVGGNSSADKSFVNAQTLLANFPGDISKVKLINSMAIPQNASMLANVHGADGIGDFLERKTSSVRVLPFDEWVKSLDSSCLLVSLGVATVAKYILERYSFLPTLIMGGRVEAKPNYEGYEFNHRLDIPSFDWCLNNSDCVVSTLDTARVPRFNMLANNELADTATLKGRLIEKAKQLALARHPDYCYIYDYIAVQFLLRPEMFDIVSCVEQDGNKINMLKARTSSVEKK